MSAFSIASIKDKLRSPFIKGKVPVYHSISKNNKPAPFNSGIHNISSLQFEKQLILLKRNHDFVFIDELAGRVRKGKNIRRLISITFDDGYKNFSSNALPILESLNIPSTMFLTTGTLDGNVIWRDKVRLIMDKGIVLDFLEYITQDLGILHSITPDNFYQESKNPNVFNSSDMNKWLDIYLAHKCIEATKTFEGIYLSKTDIKPHPLVQYGNHTENHFMMSSLNKRDQFQEIEKAQQSLKNLKVSLSEAFAVPFGNQISYNDHTLAAVHELGYKTTLLAQGDRIRGFSQKRKTNQTDGSLVGMRFLPKRNIYF